MNNLPPNIARRAARSSRLQLAVLLCVAGLSACSPAEITNSLAEEMALADAIQYTGISLNRWSDLYYSAGVLRIKRRLL
jgi:hypothetical protein